MLNIIHEDEDLLVINKPPGLLTSTVPHEKRPTALAMVRAYLEDTDPRARVGLIHRLDKDASGLLVFSRNRAAYESLKKQFFDHSAGRVYAAIVRGVPNPREGTIKSKLVEYVDGTVHVTTRGDKGERAVTHYKTIRFNKTHALIRVALETGRKHQIRAHLAQRGNPILNDPLYAREKPAGQLMLAAIELSITHPRTGKKIDFEIPLPAHMRKAVPRE